MKPIPIAIGAVAAVVVVAAIASFLLLGGEDGTTETAITPSARQPAGLGTETTLQVGDQAGGAIAEEPSGLPQQRQEQEGLPTLPWQADDLTDLEQGAAESLAAIEDAAPRAAWVLVDADWLADEMALTDSLAVTLIRELAETEPDLAGQVAGLHWLADDLAEEEVLALATIGNLAGAGPETLAAALETQWLRDGIAEEDLFTLAILEDIAGEDPALARRMAESPELADGISGAELAAFTGSDNYYLERIERDHPDLAEIVKGYAWLSDSASLNIGSRGPDLLASPLLDDGLTDYERSALSDLAYIAGQDEALAQRVAGWPWLVDGVTQIEAVAVFDLSFIVHREVSMARGLAELPWLADAQLTDTESRFLVEIYHLLEVQRGMVGLLLDQPWFQDSISNGEGAALIVMSTGCSYQSHCRQLIENPQIKSQTLDLPFGEVNLHLISRNPLGADADTIFQESHKAMTILEEFMERAWGVADFPIYVEPEWQYVSDVGGFYASSSSLSGFHLSRYVMIADAGLFTLRHELAHNYSNKGARWLREGGANFLGQYIDIGEYYSTIPETQIPGYADEEWECWGSKNIHERNLSTSWMPVSVWLPIRDCDYTLGERFLSALYINLGREMVAGSLQELFLDTDFPGVSVTDDAFSVIQSTPKTAVLLGSGP